MKIIQIGPFPLSGSIASGGVEASIYGLAKEQAKSNSVVVIDMPRIDGKDTVEQMDDVMVYRYCNHGKHNRDSIKRIEEIVKQILTLNPSVCHIHGTGIFSLKVFEVLKKKNIPLILTVHGLIKEEKLKSLKNRFSIKTLYQFWTQTSTERKLLQLASNVIVDTQYVANQIDNNRLSSKSKLTIIPQGIDNKFFQLSCSPNSRKILSVGAFSRRKCHLLLIRAFEKVARQVPDATLTICGVVAERAYFNELTNYVNASPFKDKITILTNLSKEQLMAQYKEAHVFALHSHEESQGIVFAEAMAAGLPIVATNVGGIPFVVENGVTGFLSDYGDVDTFVSSIVKMLTIDEAWTNMSISGKSISRKYSWDIIARKVETVYNTVI